MRYLELEWVGAVTSPTNTLLSRGSNGKWKIRHADPCRSMQSMFFLLEKMVPICISCLLLGTIKQLHWDDLRKSRSQEIGISDSWDLRPRRTWQSLDLAAISVSRCFKHLQAANFSLTSQWSPFFTQGGPVFLSSQFSSSKLSLWIAGDFSTSLYTAAYLAPRREASANSSATVFSSSVSPGAWDDSQASATYSL